MKAQHVVVASSGFVETTFRGRVVDSLTSEPLPSAVISVVSKDLSGDLTVRNCVADGRGYFQFVCNPRKQNRMEVAVLGYKPHTVYLVADQQERDLGLIRLPQSIEQIDEVVVRARIQMYKMKGDTIIYQPRAVNTMKDDPMGEILRHMPGVEVAANGAVTILGQPVERTYVNEKLLFGEDPTVAIKQIDAKEVASIQAYDEIDEADAVVHGANARKRKVLNIVTFKDFAQSLTAKARGEIGTDFHADTGGNHPMRYAASGEVGFYSEALQVAASGQSNNLVGADGGQTRPQKTLRMSNASASVSGKAGQWGHFNAGYNYSGHAGENLTTSIMDYFPSRYYSSQRIIDTLHNQKSKGNHTISARYNYQAEKSTFSTSLQVALSDNLGITHRMQQTLRDEKFLSATDLMDEDRGKERYLNWSAAGSRKFEGGRSFSAHVAVVLRGVESRGLRLERRTTDTGEMLTEQEIYAPAPDNQVEAGLDYGLDFGKAGSLSFRSGVTYSGQTERKLYTDLATGAEDRARSEDALDRTVRWHAGTNYILRRNNSSFHADLKYDLEHRLYDDRMKGTTNNRNFHLVTGTLWYNYRKPKKNFSVMVNTSTGPLWGFLLSSRIDDANPRAVSTGNAALVPTRDYILSLRSEFMGRKSSYGFNVSLTAVTDPVVFRRLYFKEATPLPDYGGYIMPAGATFSRPENGIGHLKVAVLGRYKVRIAPLRVFFTLEAQYAYSNPQEMLDDRTGRTHNHRAEVIVDVTTNFSPQFRIGLKNRVGGEYQNGLGVSGNELLDQLTTTIQWDVFYGLFLRADYSAYFQHSSSRGAAPNSHLLNASVGYRILKQRGRIAVNAYDILNNFSPVGFNQNTQGITTYISHMGSNYFTVSFEYKFNNRK